MVHLKNPPLPKNKNLMAGMAVLIFGLLALTIALMDDVIEKPKKNSEIQQQIIEVEHQLQMKDEALHSAATDEVARGNNFDSEVSLSKTGQSGAGKFASQEKKLSTSTTNESDYLKDRAWGFWYIILPLFVIVGIFLLWVKKKHKDWTR